MYDWFVLEEDLFWFDDPQSPAPPLYKRPAGSVLEPVCETPTGNIRAGGKLVQLTPDQVVTWLRA